ncbi:hypothetical protein PSPO01_15564 [Paraphaeosphaeria sporulosa]
MMMDRTEWKTAVSQQSGSEGASQIKQAGTRHQRNSRGGWQVCAAEETAYIHIANTGVQSQSAKRRGEAAAPTRPGGMTDEPHTNVPLPIVDGDQPVRPQRESRPVTFFDGTTWRGTTTEPTTLDPDAAPDTTRVTIKAKEIPRTSTIAMGRDNLAYSKPTGRYHKTGADDRGY